MDIKAFKSRDLKQISENSLFKNISPEKVLSICAGDGCSVISYGRGDVIFSPDSFFKSCGLILTGSVSVSKSSSDDRVLLMNTLSLGSLFGAAALWTEHSRYVTKLTALEKCRIVFFSQKLMESSMNQYPELAANYIRFLSERICFLNDKIQSLISGCSKSSLKQHLLEQFELFGPELCLEHSISGLASMLNVSRASLYRAFGALENGGIIRRSGRSITILDINKLRRFQV